MAKDKSFIRIYSMDATSLVKNVGKQEDDVKNAGKQEGGVKNAGKQEDDSPATADVQVEEIKASLPLSQCPVQPVPLAADPVVEYAMNAYDIALVLVPMLLITKAILCIVAAHKDQDASGLLVDEVSSMTLNLINFNDQVSATSPELSNSCTDTHCSWSPYLPLSSS